jgi:hypothetical protein
MDLMKIFISYRRDDSAGYAGRLFDYLSSHFGPGNVFMDIDTIEPGDDFRKTVRNAVSACDVVLVMIGKQWLNATDGQGYRRLDQAGDWVRIEIATALADPDVRVIPVLLRNASMPGETELPDDLKELAWRNAIELSDSRFQHDAGKLVGVIERTVEKPGTVPLTGQQKSKGMRTWPVVLASLGVLLVSGLALYGFITRGMHLPGIDSMTDTQTTETVSDSSLVWQDDFDDGTIDVNKWILPTDPSLIFEQDGVMNFSVLEDQSQNGEIWSGLEARNNPKPIQEITFTVMLNSHGAVSSGGVGIDLFLKHADPILSVVFEYDSDEVAGYFLDCPDYQAFNVDYEKCLSPTPIPNQDGGFPSFDGIPVQIRVVSTGESIDFHANGVMLASRPVSAWIENFQFYVSAEQAGTIQGTIDDLQVTYVDE